MPERLEAYLDAVAASIGWRRARPFVLLELRTHLLEQKEDFLASGSAQTRALLTFALSGEESMHYPVAADGEKFTLRVEKSDDFSAVSSEKNYAASALSDLPQCAVSGLLLSIF